MADTTPTLREAAQQALEALAPLANATTPAEREALTDADAQAADAASCDLRAALAEQDAEQASPAYLAEPGAAQATRADLVANWPEHNRARMTVALHYAAPAAEQAEPSEHRPDPEWYARMIRETAGDDFVVGPAFKLPEQAEPVAAPASIVAGAIFDFAGFLTTHKCVIKVGSTANASPVVERIKEWAGLRGLPIDDADVLSWQKNTAPPAPAAGQQAPIDMVLHCPACGLQHIDEADPPVEFEPGAAQWSNPPHRSHLCHGCGHIWRPADIPTNGVAAIKTKGKADSPPAPARQEPLTDEQITEACRGIFLSDYRSAREYDFAIARAIERAHGITAAPAEGGAA